MAIKLQQMQLDPAAGSIDAQISAVSQTVVAEEITSNPEVSASVRQIARQEVASAAKMMKTRRIPDPEMIYGRVMYITPGEAKPFVWTGDSCAMTDYIRISPNARRFDVELHTAGSVYGYILFDRNYDMVSYGIPPETGDFSGTLDFAEEVLLRPAAKYVRFMHYLGTARYPSVTVTDVVQCRDADDADPLRGKAYAAFGDSYTNITYAGGDKYGLSGEQSLNYDRELGLYKTYPVLIARRHGMTLLQRAQSGQRTCWYDDTYPTPGASPAAPGSMNYTIRQVVENAAARNAISAADYITFALGCNDGNMASRLGDLASDDVHEYYGAWNTILSNCYALNPDAKYGFIVNERNAYTGEAVRQALVNVAAYWGIPCLDMSDAKVPVSLPCAAKNMNPYAVQVKKDAFDLSSNSPHPNPACHEYRSTVIENFLKSL